MLTTAAEMRANDNVGLALRFSQSVPRTSANFMAMQALIKLKSRLAAPVCSSNDWLKSRTQARPYSGSSPPVAQRRQLPESSLEAVRPVRLDTNLWQIGRTVVER